MRHLFNSVAFLLVCVVLLHADVFRWDSGTLIPRTSEVEPGPEIELPGRQLQFAGLSNLDLRRSDFSRSNLSNADFSRSDLSNSNLRDAVLERVNFTDANIRGLQFGAEATERGLTAEQIYSTASYKNRDLRSVLMWSSNLEGWDLSGQDLREAGLSGSLFDSANLSDANLRGTDLRSSSFSNANLQGANLSRALLFEGSFANANLVNANLSRANLTDLEFAGADLTDANISGIEMGQFFSTAGTSMSEQQLYSTSSYQARRLGAIEIREVDWSGWSLERQRLVGAEFHDVNLTRTNFSNANLTDARIWSTMTGADFSGAILTDAWLDGDVTNANFENARVARTALSVTGLTQEQIYSTQSYRDRNLQGIWLNGVDQTGWDFQGMDLRGASLGPTLVNATLDNAQVQGVSFSHSNLTREQLYSTRSYREGNLEGIDLGLNDLAGWNFRDQDLRQSDFGGATLAGADFTNANVQGASFYGEESLSPEQLYSTASYQEKNLTGIEFSERNLDGWDFRDQDLSNAWLYQTRIRGADLEGAIVTGANFTQFEDGRGPTKEQIYSTKSYRDRNLRKINFSGNNLDGWDFSQQDLRGTGFGEASLQDAIFDGANVVGVGFSSTLTKQQLVSTSSYETRDLRGVTMNGSDLTDLDFSETNLAHARLERTDLTGANLADADLSFISLREAQLGRANLSNANLSNANLEGARLLPADMRGANLSNANFFDTFPHAATMDETTIYNQWTVFPDYFDPEERGLTFVESPVGDFVPDGQLNVEDYRFLNQYISPNPDFDESGFFQLNRPFWQDAMVDVNEDTVVDKDDERFWVQQIVQAIPGDTDFDGDVDFVDFLRVSDGFGKPGDWTTGDFDFNGRSEFADFLVLSGHFGSTTGTATVPEPSSSTLLCICLACSMLISRKRRAPML